MGDGMRAYVKEVARIFRGNNLSERRRSLTLKIVGIPVLFRNSFDVYIYILTVGCAWDCSSGSISISPPPSQFFYSLLVWSSFK